MFLYDKKDKTIDVFTLTHNPQEIRDYKIEQMKKIPPHKRSLFTEEIVSNCKSTPVLFKKDLNSEIIDISELRGPNKSLNYNTDMEDVADLLEWFYQSEQTDDKQVARVSDFKMLKYLLIAGNYFSSKEENGKIILKVVDIIQIPKSLYLLQLLLQEKFSTISGEDISEQLSLFNFSYVNNINLDELQKMDACGITENAYSRIINKANNDKPVLKLLKK